MPLEQIQVWISQYGYAAIYVLLTLGIVGLPVPDETLLALTGFLVFQGKLHGAPTYIAALSGTVSGISLSYAIGRIGGKRFLRRFGQSLHVTPARLDKVHAWFARRGRWTLAIAYFVPGVRHVIAIVAGSSGTEFGVFALFAYSGACIWSAVFILAGYYLGEGWAEFPDLVRRLAIGVFVVAVVTLGAFAFLRSRKERKGHRH